MGGNARGGWVGEEANKRIQKKKGKGEFSPMKITL